jgi:hypothetical protein
LAGAPVSYSVTMFTTLCGTMKIDLIVRFSTYFATGGNARACARIVASELEISTFSGAIPNTILARIDGARRRPKKGPPTDGDKERFARGEINRAILIDPSWMHLDEVCRVTRNFTAAGGWRSGTSREISVGLERHGDVLVAQGNLPEALKSFRDGLAIRDRLAKADPGNAGWQRDFAISYSKLGDVFTKRDKAEDAIHNYRFALAIMNRLTTVDATNLRWQADVIEFNYDLAINGDNSADRFAYVMASLRKLKSERELSAEQAGWLAEAEIRLAKAQPP